MKLEKTCKVHGVSEEKDIAASSQPQNKSGFQLRCKKCAFEARMKKRGTCIKHGKLSEEDIKGNGRCSICHRESANRKRDNNRDWFNDKMARDRQANPESGIKYTCGIMQIIKLSTGLRE